MKIKNSGRIEKSKYKIRSVLLVRCHRRSAVGLLVPEGERRDESVSGSFWTVSL
ncbi:unnamed protein product [Acanthoscelides obtectus]|uniref:Uncharacterized protein n=1 Tax=Acanthoscelides obtectus TaxID=200917 RepID=A0A9P0JZT7_ACAOB|nr:unnamed protein product [Acanthoscelides obtectus]CAK1666059.1 hypothetical protein AOBTE_LOCUS25135 [Acanthoscelides obtectus]